MTEKAELKAAAATVSGAISRAWGLANALSFISEANPSGNSSIRFSQLTDALDELSGAMKEALSPAIEAADDLMNAFKEEEVA